MQLKFDWKKGHKTNPEEYEKEPIIFFEYTEEKITEVIISLLDEWKKRGERA